MRLFFLAIFLFPTAALAALPSAQLAYSDAPRENRIETVRVTLTVPPEHPSVVVSVQDARGGPIFSRVLTGSGEHVLFMPLAYVGSSNLPPNSWPLRITTAVGPSGPFLSNTLVVLSHPAALSAAALRVLTAQSSDLDPSPLAEVTSGPVVFLHCSLDELLDDPPLTFASCDVLLLDRRAAASLPPDRAAALIAAGLVLVYPSAAGPPHELDSFLWVRPQVSVSAPSGASTAPALPRLSAVLWQTPPSASAVFPPIALLEPALSQVHPPALKIPSALKVSALLVTPAALLLVGLVAVMMPHRRQLRLPVLGGLFPLGTAALLVSLHFVPMDASGRFAITTRHPAAEFAGTETFVTATALFGHPLTLSTSDPIPLLPVAATPESWFALAPARIVLEPPTPSPAALTMLVLPSRRPYLFKSRAITQHPLKPLAQSAVFLIHAGQVAPRTGSASVPFALWVAGQPQEARLPLSLWYALRCVAAGRYGLSPLIPAGPANPTTLIVTDLSE